MKNENTIPGFYQLKLPLANDFFPELSSSIDFEEVGKGRLGNHLVKTGDAGIPLVRTTSKYDKPAHQFSDTHDLIANSIISAAKNIAELQNASIAFNNALIEIYNKDYFKMGYHSDQVLDLAGDSYVALFSCYERPTEVSPPFLRRLKVKNKITNEIHEFLLANNSVILFPLSTNSKYHHKIVLDASTNQKDLLPDNRWLGITFRQSKTFIHFQNNLPYFANGDALKLANEDQQREFYSLRSKENKSLDFDYPSITYTLSNSDILLPK